MKIKRHTFCWVALVSVFIRPPSRADCCSQLRGRLPPGVDGWGVSLRGLMGMVVLGGLLVAGTYFWLQRTVVPGVVAALPPKAKKHKENMSIGESFNFLAKSTYIRDLAALVSFTQCSHLAGDLKRALSAESVYA